VKLRCDTSKGFAFTYRTKLQTHHICSSGPDSTLCEICCPFVCRWQA